MLSFVTSNKHSHTATIARFDGKLKLNKNTISMIDSNLRLYNECTVTVLKEEFIETILHADSWENLVQDGVSLMCPEMRSMRKEMLRPILHSHVQQCPALKLNDRLLFNDLFFNFKGGGGGVNQFDKWAKKGHY